MSLEAVRLVADWLADAATGVTALVGQVPRDAGDPAPGAVAVYDATRTGWVARGFVGAAPGNLTFPCVAVAATHARFPAAPRVASSGAYVQDGEQAVVCYYLDRDPDSAAAAARASYARRAARGSLDQFHAAPAATARTRNGVQLVLCAGVEERSLAEAFEDVVAYGATLVTYKTRETVGRVAWAPAVIVPTGTTVTLSASSVAEDGTPPTLAAAVLPTGAPQAGLWSSDAPSVATVDATTGAVTLVGPGSVTFTFTPTGHPEAAGSATLTVTAALNPANPDDLIALLNAAPADPVTGKLTVEHAWLAGRGHTAGAGVKTTWTSFYNKPGLAALDAVARTDTAGFAAHGLYYDPTIGTYGRMKYRTAGNVALDGLVIGPHADLSYDQGRSIINVSRVVRGDVVYGRQWVNAAGGDSFNDDFRDFFHSATAHGRNDTSQQSGFRYADTPGDTIVRVHETVPGGPSVGMLNGRAGRDTLIPNEVNTGDALPAGPRQFFLGPHKGGDTNNSMRGDELLMLSGSGTLTRAQWDMICDFCEAHGGRSEAARPQAILTGNSLIQIFTASTWRDDMYAAGWDTVNQGQAGVAYGTVGVRDGNLNGRFPWVEGQMRNPRRARQIVAVYEFVNTGGVGLPADFNATAQTVYTKHKAYAQRCKDAGFQVLGVTPLPWKQGTDTTGALAQAIRTLMLNDAAFWGGVSKIADIGNPAAGQTGDPARLTNATYYSDGVHWNPTQYNACVPELKRALLAIAAG